MSVIIFVTGRGYRYNLVPTAIQLLETTLLELINMQQYVKKSVFNM